MQKSDIKRMIFICLGGIVGLIVIRFFRGTSISVTDMLGILLISIIGGVIGIILRKLYDKVVKE